MNCSKCNTEIPEGAKFCPACGQKSELSMPRACSACGIELSLNSKFCPICGTPVAAPANSVPQPVNSVPQPVNSVPQPVNSAPQPVNSAPQPASSDYAFGGTAPAPRVDLSKGASFAADAAEQPSTLPDYGFSAASAVTVTPIKKSGGKIAAIIGIAAAAVVAVLAVIFALNKGPVMNLFMGNEGYAKMIESKTVDSITDAAANPVVTSGVEALSSTFASAMESASEDIAEGTLDASSAKDYSNSINFAALIANANKFMSEAYGTNAVSVSLTPHVELTDTAKALITEGEEEETAELEKILSSINGAALAGTFSTREDIIGIGGSVSEGGFTADAKMLMTADGKMYISFPFGSDKAVMIPIEQAETAPEDAPSLVLEEEEIKRLAKELGDIYLKYYENGEITIDKDGTLSAAGATAEGKLITVDIKGGQIKEMFAEIASTIAEDEYFRTRIVSFANACGSDLTETEYKEEIMSSFEVDVNESDILRLQTIVNKNNNVLAKSLSAIAGESSVSFTYINGKDSAAVEVIEDGTTLFSANITKTDENNGTANLKFSDGDSYPVSVKMDYSDLKTEKFLKSDVITGTLTFSVTPPADFTEAEEDDDLSLTAILAQSKFILSGAVNGSTYEETFTFDCPQYGSIKLTSKLSGDAAFDLSVPADVIDCTGITDGTADEAVYEQIDALISEITAKAENYPDSYIAQALTGSLSNRNDDYYEDDYPDFSNDPLEERRTEFCEAVSADIDTLYDIYYDNIDVIEEMYFDEFRSLSDTLYDIYSDAYAAQDEAQFDKLAAKLEKAETDINDLGAKVKISAVSQTLEPDSFDNSAYYLPEYDYDLLSYEELIDAMTNAEDVYLAIAFSYSDKLLYDDDISKLYEDCSTKYLQVYEDIMALNNAISEGNLSIPLLREARKSAAKFDESLRKLQTALESYS